ncbi:DUF636 domain-containing protein [Collybia nuda]|uniref:DUF636 domain-containing protein n=1 Tax=Collybia nuda TaxID=64659 RepID=A0A9P6CHW8_9AGAR|nr:DUF636 domain-containing protein [Collybia nuda]
MASTHRGSCLCGAIKYEITGDPFTYLVCHCINCKKATGSPFMANAFFKTDQLSITQGKETIKNFRDDQTASGSAINRSFCPDCGSSLFIVSATNDCAIVSTGTLDDPVTWTPRRENFTERKFHWVTGLTTNPKPRSKL